MRRGGLKDAGKISKIARIIRLITIFYYNCLKNIKILEKYYEKTSCYRRFWK
ncbi:hypothetical protein CAMRE0001_2732 [Campylobacter rectus RM3267]|uniref:Uncharacterized protein n=1 Tax=Campylobacter rectus RM3267 TaxID=553218 RepID=B9D0T6_CAMRE|nr:hypothetical protein CAMRE0001_2732 [Campylobacter rectus RM3267]